MPFQPAFHFVRAVSAMALALLLSAARHDAQALKRYAIQPLANR